MLPQDLGILTLPGTFSTDFFMMFKDMFCTVLHVFFAYLRIWPRFMNVHWMKIELATFVQCYSVFVFFAF